MSTPSLRRFWLMALGLWLVLGTDKAAAQSGPFSMQVQPQPIAGLITTGSTADLTVTVRGNDFRNMSFTWKRNGEVYLANSRYLDSEFEVSREGPPFQITNRIRLPMQVASNGVYQCRISLPGYVMDSDAVKVAFYPTPRAVQRSPFLLVHEGGPVTLQADVASTNPVLKYQWQFNAHTMPNAAANPYSILAATMANAGTYRLLAGTVAGTLVSDNTSLAVVEGAARTVVAAAGRPLVLTAKTAGTGLTFLWKRKDGQVLNPARMTGINAASLKIAKPNKEEDATGYLCEVSHAGIATPLSTGLITLVVESEKPVLSAIALPEGSVALPYAGFRITASHTTTRFNVSGLPAGLACDPLTGIISGTPQAGGTFNVKVSATNPVGTSPVTIAKLIIGKLDRRLVGTSTGLVVSGSDYLASLTITVSESGHFTGRSTGIFGNYTAGRLTTTAPFAGQLQQDAEGNLTGDSTSFTLPAASAGSGTRASHLTLYWEPLSLLRATLHVDSDEFDFYTTTLTRNQWNARTNPATKYAGYYTVAMDQQAADIVDSSGSGYACFTVTTGGAFTYAGRLPDGTAFAIPGFIDQEGFSSFLAWLYGYKGQLAGSFGLGNGSPPLYRDTDVQGVLHWQRPPSTFVAPVPVYTGYHIGIDRNLILQGARYLPPNLAMTTSPYMMNTYQGPLNITLSVSGPITPEEGYTVDATLNTRHTTAFPAYVKGGTMRYTSLVFTAANGRFTGTATFYIFNDESGVPLYSYPLNFQGIVTRANATSADGYGTGYYTRLFPYVSVVGGPNFPPPPPPFNLLYSGGVKVVRKLGAN